MRLRLAGHLLPRTDASDSFQLGILRARASIFATFFLPARSLRALVVPGAADKSISSRSIMVTTPSSSVVTLGDRAGVHLTAEQVCDAGVIADSQTDLLDNVLL